MAITVNKKSTIQLLRNSQIYTSRELAKAGLESSATLVEDGCPLLARYTKGSGIGALLGIKNTINNITKVVIFADIDDSESDVANAISDALDNLDLAQVGGTGKIITTISQTDGVVSAAAMDATANNISINTANFANTNVENALNTLYNRSNITVDETSGTGSTLKSYAIKQNGTTIGTINIPKDLVVQSGSVVSGTWNGSTFTENVSGTDNALKLVIANQTTPIYIDIAKLIDVYTPGDGVNVSNTNEISLQLDNTTEGFLTLGQNGLKLSGVQDAIDTAMNGRLSNITVNSVNGTVTNGVASVTLKTNNIKLNTGVSSGTFGAITTSDTITTALQKLYGGIVANQSAIIQNTITNSDQSITVTPGSGSTDIKVNIIDCGTYTI